FGLGLILIIFPVLFFTRKDQPEKADTKSQEFMTVEFEKQVQLKEKYREALAESDAVKEKKHEETLMYQSFLNQQKGIEENWQAFLSEHHLPTTLDLFSAEDIFTQTNQLHQLLEKDKVSLEKQTALQATLSKQTAPISS